MERHNLKPLYLLTIINFLLIVFVLYVLVTGKPPSLATHTSNSPSPSNQAATEDRGDSLDSLPITALETEDSSVENVVVTNEDGTEIILRSDANQ